MRRWLRIPPPPVPRQPCDCAALAEQNSELRADLAEARAILAPLLARPFAPGTILCLFCRRQEGTFDALGVMTGSHAPGCPVLRAEALLGREGERG